MKTIRTAILYKDYKYNLPLRVWDLEKQIDSMCEDYKDKAIEILLLLVLDYFGSDINKISFPEPLKGEFLSVTIETKEEKEIFQITLGV